MVNLKGRHNVPHSTHIPVLLRVLNVTSGPILEMGVGNFSTPLLHFACLDSNRVLQSYDNDPRYIKGASPFSCALHLVDLIDDWDKADINKFGFWSLALIDHKPAERRIIDIERLAKLAEYIVCHDSEPIVEHVYNYKKVFPLFKYIWNYTKVTPNTLVLSNFHDLRNLFGGPKNA